MGDQGGASKKTLSDLTREELIEKCKNYLQIAQKAKTAKDGELDRFEMKTASFINMTACRCTFWHIFTHPHIFVLRRLIHMIKVNSSPIYQGFVSS